MYSNYEFKSDGSLKQPSSGNKATTLSLRQKVKRYILKYNLDLRITKK